MTIDVLPDVALLEIFDFYVHEAWEEEWQTLVHVCRKWRHVVFGSPRRLDLRLHCRASTPVRKTLDIWPLLPIIVSSNVYRKKWGVDNVVAVLEHADRICQFTFLGVSSSQWKKVLPAMQQPFPALTCLDLRSKYETAPVVPASLLGGYAPHVQSLTLDCIPFPSLPNLLLSATHLVELDLRRIPHSGYISPEAMVTGLSALTRLGTLVIEFESPQSRPDRNSRRPPPLTRILLPNLADLNFKGVCEYLEDLVARIDAPLLDNLDITLFHQLIFDAPRLTQFIGRTPMLKAFDEANVIFTDSNVLVLLSRIVYGSLNLGVMCSQSDWQLSSLALVCSSSFLQALVPAVERLYIRRGVSLRYWQDDIESSQWVELLHPFTAVKDFYISSEFMPRIPPVLQELVGERVTEVLPALQTIFLGEIFTSRPVQEAIEQFVAARQITGHPVGISHW